MRKILDALENTEISFGSWVCGFAGVVIVRFFLETFSSPSLAFPAAPDGLTMVHYFLFFLGVFLSLVLVVRIFVPDIGRITKLFLFGFPIIWLPPIVDLIKSGGGGYGMAYIFFNPGNFWSSVITFGGHTISGGMTPGIRTEVAAIVVGVAFYVFSKTRNILKAIGAAVGSYLVVFIWLAAPSILAFTASLFGSNQSYSSSLVYIIQSFSISHISGGVFRMVAPLTSSAAGGTFFNVVISLVFYLVNFLLIAGWVFLWRADFARAIIRNTRPERIGHYFLALILGVAVGIRASAGNGSLNWVDIVAITDLLIVYASAWLFAVATNDIIDVRTDALSNTDRPLITHAMSVLDMKNVAACFFLLSLVGAFVLGYWTFFLVLVFTAAYYIYSAPPLRLKRVPMLATCLIALACLTAAMAGFYLVSSDKFISGFPKVLVLIIMVGVTLGANIKDVKDLEGDRAEGIMTIPSVFGARLGKQIVGALVAVSFLVVPAVLHSWAIFWLALVAAAAGYALINKEPYREWRFFMLYFAYAALAWIAYSLFPVPL